MLVSLVPRGLCPVPWKEVLKMNDAAKLRLHRRASVLTIVVGVALLIMMVVVESEPGALPLLLIVLGTGWYFVTGARARSRQQ